MPATKRKSTKNTKKRSKSRAKEAPVEHELPGGFWRQISAIVMMALALFFVITWFGQGGTILNAVHKFIVQWLGFATFFIPALLVYLAVKIFRAEDNRVATPVYFASVLMIFWLAGIAAIWKNGGILGDWLNSLMLNVLNQGVVIFIYIILIFITALFILQLSPITFFKGTKNLANRDKSSSDDEPKKKKLGQLEIKVNSGLATSEPTAKSSSLLHKSAIKKPEPAKEPTKEPTALIAASDPNWKMPTVDLLEKKQSPADAGNIQQNAYIIKSTLAEFGIDVEMEGANVGPRVTQYTMKPPAGVNLSKILARDKELALNLAVDKIRIEAPIPGTRSVGVEIPNARSADVRLRGVLESSEWKKSTDPLSFAVGKDISGHAVVANLAKMPHLLIAGTTGSGKSVMTNTLISSLLYRNTPSDMKLIIVDPKQVEMAQYQDIPHLLTPIITQTEKALSAMKWAVGEMERRYTLMAEEKVKNIADYNVKIAKTAADGQDDKPNKMPYIVIVIDEMADLMMMAGKDLELLIVRIAQKGRAAGVHLVLATQRPEVKVITGLIKANIPGRIAFAVGSRIDSQIMLDQGGAEKLLGKGDMLFLTTEMMGKPRRLQGAWASDEDINKVTDFLRAQRPPEYNDEVIAQQVAIKGMSSGGSASDLGRTFDPNDPTVRKAVEITLKQGKFSTASLQAWLGKGHGFVAGLAIWLEEIGVIGPQNGNKPREVLISSMEEFDELAGA
ncbi:DUF87 domain-containing protein [Candidatus Saccharibacteria bacterium]|nr:DUF87 domain-containing protein [Candidatus Saccharibacteria bacterium]